MQISKKLILGIVLFFISSIILVYLASPEPDILENIIDNNRLSPKDSFSLFDDYSIPGVQNSFVGKVLVTMIGVGIILTVSYIIGRVFLLKK